MTDVIKFGEKKTYIDATLQANMDDMKKELKKDNDIIIVIDGRERIGKSVFAQMLGWYMSEGKLTIKNICLTAPEFQKRVKEAKPNETILFDECYLGMSSADAMKHYNRLLMKMLVMCGQKNLCLILVLPSVFDLQRYVPLHRADVLIHCFKHKGQRGHFAFYNAQKMKSLYINGKKFYSYYRPKPNFHGRFTNFYAVDEAEYRLKKLESLNNFLKEKEEEDVGARKELLYRSICFGRNTSKLDNKELAKELHCSTKTIQRAVRWENSQKTGTEDSNIIIIGKNEGRELKKDEFNS